MKDSFGGKDCLVTGYGFVSNHLIDYLCSMGANVTVVEKNLPSTAIPPDGVRMIKADVRYLIDKSEYDYVFHLAGITNAAYAESNPMEAYEANVLSTCNLLNNVRVREKFVFTSSAVVYGNSDLGRLLSEDEPTHPISIYGATKVAAEELIRTFGRTRGLSYDIVRFFNLYGPGQTIFYIVPQIIIQALRDKVVSLRNDKVERDFLFVGDAVESVAKVATSEPGGGVFNIGSGVPVPLRKLAETILDVMGDKSIQIEAGTKHDSFSASSLTADITRVRSTGWTQKTALRDGLKLTIPHYRRALTAQKLLTEANSEHIPRLE